LFHHNVGNSSTVANGGEPSGEEMDHDDMNIAVSHPAEAVAEDGLHQVAEPQAVV
jgi:hypothetical protein